MRMVAVMTLFALTAACAPYEAPPASVYQWERQQEAVARDYAARVALCRTLDRESEAFARDCANLREFRQ